MTKTENNLFPQIQHIIGDLEFDTLAADRKRKLQSLIDFIQTKVSNKQEIRLNFICTHNSRRSHLCQVWAQTAASYYNIKKVYCYSGGTEVTALFPEVAKTLEQNGFQIKTLSKGENPIYEVKYAANQHPILGFSKKYDDSFNPNSDFAAVLTCTQADQGCPFISGAELRIALPFEDPKAFDNTAQQSEKYNERSLEIATELLYVFSKIKSN